MNHITVPNNRVTLYLISNNTFVLQYVIEVQFNAQASKSDVSFAKILLEQFGGPNGELKAAMRYFIQAVRWKKQVKKVDLHIR